MIGLLPLRYEGEGQFLAIGRAKQCDAAYVIGAISLFERHEERSLKSHQHYMATVADLWANLPEHMTGRWPSPDALRYFALIKTGFCTEQQTICANSREAIALAAFILRLDPYSIAEVTDNIVTIWRAKSQKMRGEGAMEKDEFQASKTAVLEFIEELIESGRVQTQVAA